MAKLAGAAAHLGASYTYKLGLREHVSAEADVLLCEINVAYLLD